MVPHTLPVLLAHVGKSEGLKDVRVRVELVVVVHRSCGRDDDGAFWYERAVRERKVFDRFAYQTHYIMLGKMIDQSAEKYIPPLNPSMRSHSLRKLSIFCILPNAAFVHPSS